MSDGRILVTGATGYIGGRLVKRLLEKGCRVTAMGRQTGKACGPALPRGPESGTGCVLRTR